MSRRRYNLNTNFCALLTGSLFNDERNYNRTNNDINIKLNIELSSEEKHIRPITVTKDI